MTAMLEHAPEKAATEDADRYASWPARAGAFTLDFLPGVAVIATMALLALTAPRGSWPWWTFTVSAAATALAMLVNRLVLPSVTGWSLGRAVAGIQVVRPDGSRPSSVRLLGRELAHILDTACLFVGWLWPLWDRNNRTFADLLLRTEVRVVGRQNRAAGEAPQRDVRRMAGTVLVAAALLCAAAAGLGYLQVYGHQRAIERARTQIAEQGPRIVEELLTYGTDTVVDDFARAQTLATDGYRPLLIAQQQSVQKSGVTNNEYWAVSSAVLPGTTPDKAALLLALQGQRGTDPNSLKFITATVRADFEKSGDHWRVAVLTVLKKPQTNQPVSEPKP